MQVSECTSLRIIFDKHEHHLARMNKVYKIMVLTCGSLLGTLISLSLTSATSDVNVTKLEGIESQVLRALPQIQCQERDVPTGRAMESCIFKSDLKKVFIFGFNTTTCYLCYVNSSYSKINLADIQNVNWYASKGK